MVQGGNKEGLLLYGVTGHTGRLIAAKAKEAGLKATLAGRDPSKIKRAADKMGMPAEAFDLADTVALNAAVARHVAVLHIAGPFMETSKPMLDACLRNGTHYIDLTGEIWAIEGARRRDEEAKAKGVMLLPAAGFDVVPGDCLAAYLRQKCPMATHLDLATFISRKKERGDKAVSLSPSHGTVKSAVFHILPYGGLVRRGGALRRAPIGQEVREFETGDGGPRVTASSFPAAELVCTTHSTDIPNITTYFPGATGWVLRPLSWLGPWVVNLWPVRYVLNLLISQLPQPNESRDSGVRMMCAGEARFVQDSRTVASAAASVSTGPGYLFTASAACEIARRVLAGQYKPGFQTPASAYGADLVLEIPGEDVVRTDIPVSSTQNAASAK